MNLTDLDYDRLVAMAAEHGVAIDDNATKEQVVAALEARGITAPQPAPSGPAFGPSGEAPSSSVKVGQVVEYTYRDTYAGTGDDGEGEKVTKSGLVLATTEADDGTPQAVVAFFDAPSHPIATDQLTVV